MRIEPRLPEAIRARYTLKLALVAGFVVVLVAGMGFLTYTQVSDRVTENQLDAMATDAELEAEAFQTWIDGERNAVNRLSNHHAIDPDDEETRETLIEELESMPPEASDIHLAEWNPSDTDDDSEPIVASTNQSLEGEPLEATNIVWDPEIGYDFESESDVTMSWVYEDNGQPGVALASPTPDGDHALIVEYRTNVRAEEFASSTEGTETVVVGGSTVDVLFDRNESNVITPYKGDPEATTVGQRIIEAEPDEQIQGAVLTDDSVVAYHRVPGDADWVVVKEAPRENALAVVDDVQRDLVVLLGVTLFGFVLVGVMVHRGPIRSVRSVAEQAHAISRGDLSVQIEDDGRIDEVGEVRDAFRNTKKYLETIAAQSEALAARDFDDEALDEDVPGSLGESIEKMQTDLERFIDESETIQEKATEYQEEMEAAAEGDLTVRLEPTEENEALATIATTFNQMLEEIQRRNQQLESQRDNLELLNEMVRHDIRNQLQLILAYADLLEESADDAQAEQLAIIQNCGENAVELTETAREMADVMLQSDEDTRPVPLETVLETQVQEVRSAHEDATITIDEVSETFVEANDMIDTVFRNLLKNAVQHNDTERPEVEVSVSATDEDVVVSVADNGPGVPPDQREKIFEHGEQGVDSDGMGLGLYLVATVVEQYNGSVWIEDNEPRGAVFTVRLQRADDEVSAD